MAIKEAGVCNAVLQYVLLRPYAVQPGREGPFDLRHDLTFSSKAARPDTMSPVYAQAKLSNACRVAALACSAW